MYKWGQKACLENLNMQFYIKSRVVRPKIKIVIPYLNRQCRNRFCNSHIYSRNPFPIEIYSILKYFLLWAHALNWNKFFFFWPDTCALIIHIRLYRWVIAFSSWLSLMRILSSFVFVLFIIWSLLFVIKPVIKRV